jgi:hypothetical protein
LRCPNKVYLGSCLNLKYIAEFLVTGDKSCLLYVAALQKVEKNTNVSIGSKMPMYPQVVNPYVSIGSKNANVSIGSKTLMYP